MKTLPSFYTWGNSSHLPEVTQLTSGRSCAQTQSVSTQDCALDHYGICFFQVPGSASLNSRRKHGFVRPHMERGIDSQTEATSVVHSFIHSTISWATNAACRQWALSWSRGCLHLPFTLFCCVTSSLLLHPQQSSPQNRPILSGKKIQEWRAMHWVSNPPSISLRPKLHSGGISPGWAKTCRQRLSGTVHTHLFPVPCSVTSCWYLEISHGGSIYTMMSEDAAN